MFIANLKDLYIFKMTFFCVISSNINITAAAFSVFLFRLSPSSNLPPYSKKESNSWSQQTPPPQRPLSRLKRNLNLGLGFGSREDG